MASDKSNNDLSNEQQDVVGQMYGGLVFLKTRDRQGMVDFYINTIGMKLWLEQPDISILSHGNLLIGFHQIIIESSPSPPPSPDLAGMYTFVYPTKEQVDVMYEKLKTSTTTTPDGPPRMNPRYRIYQFFAQDPEGRQLEFQAFLHPLDTATSQVVVD